MARAKSLPGQPGPHTSQGHPCPGHITGSLEEESQEHLGPWGRVLATWRCASDHKRTPPSSLPPMSNFTSLPKSTFRSFRVISKGDWWHCGYGTYENEHPLDILFPFHLQRVWKAPSLLKLLTTGLQLNKAVNHIFPALKGWRVHGWLELFRMGSVWFQLICLPLSVLSHKVQIHIPKAGGEVQTYDLVLCVEFYVPRPAPKFNPSSTLPLHSLLLFGCRVLVRTHF